MYTNPIEAAYFEERLQSSLNMAANAVDAGAAMAHRGLAECYRAKLRSLLRAQPLPARPVLSLNAFHDEQAARTFDLSVPAHSTGVSAMGSECLLAA